MKTESNNLKTDIQIRLQQGESFMNPVCQAKEHRKGCDGTQEIGYKRFIVMRKEDHVYKNTQTKISLSQA